MPRSDYSFMDGFFGLSTKADAAKARGEKGKTFDWVRAAQLIVERHATHASAGLDPDWAHTSGTIWRDGKPVPQTDTYTYLASMWATPTIVIDGDEIECWVPQEDRPDWDASTYWPTEALAIIAAARNVTVIDVTPKETGEAQPATVALTQYGID
jgi:hypothetical protein